MAYYDHIDTCTQNHSYKVYHKSHVYFMYFSFISSSFLYLLCNWT